MMLATVYSAAADLVVSPTAITISGDYNDTIVKSILIRNTGNTTLSGLSFSHSSLSEFVISYSADNFAILPNDNISVNVTIEIPDGTNPVQHEGSITLGNGVESATVGVEIDLTGASTLVISRLEVEGDSMKDRETKEKISPLDTVDLEITVKNNLPNDDDEITDIAITVTVKNIEDRSDDDITIEADEFDLDGDGDKDPVDLSFEVPYDVEHQKDYEIEIEVEGVDEDDNEYRVEYTVFIEIKKDKNLMRIRDYRIMPEALTCTQRNAEIEATIANIGSNDQDDTVLDIENALLGIDKKFIFETDSDPDKDNFEVSKDYSFNVPEDAQPGTYDIELYLYYDMDKRIDHRTVSLVVPDCNPTTTTTSTVPDQGGQTGIIPGIQPGITPGMSYSSETEGLRTSSLYTALLVVLIIAVVVGIIFMIVKLFRSFY
jgi:hypothetical protein